MSTSRIVFAALSALLLFWGVGAYNRLVSLRSAVTAAWAPIDAQLRRRQALAFDLATALAELPAMSDEVGRSTLQTVVAATRQAQAAADHARCARAAPGRFRAWGWPSRCSTARCGRCAC